MKKYALGAGAAALMFGACAEGPQNTTDNFGYEGTGIQVQVAPLTLESISDACYSFTVVNGLGELVVGRGPGAVADFPAEVTGTAMNTICASQFGNGDGGDASYVAPCDAQEDAHTVTLWVDALCDSASGAPVTNGAANWTFPSPSDDSTICTEIQPYQNPCGSAGCELPVTCVENADTPVTFNFTIMGQADQGFFDIAVNFDDVFCSAKMDTCNTEGDSIELVFDQNEFLADGTTPNPNFGERMDTLVLAVACTGGPGTGVETYLTHSTLTVNCGAGVGGSIDLDTVDQEGNQTAINGLNWAAYFGTESLADANKVFTNLAFGIPEGGACDVSWQVVPTNGPFVQAGGNNTYNSYGYVNFAGKTIRAGSDACTQLPLDGLPGTMTYNGVSAPVVNGAIAGNGVTTAYQDTDDGDFPAASQLGEGGEDILNWANP